MPIAWAFLGYDGSLTNLHVEVNYRGRGLAGCMVTKLFENVEKIFAGEASLDKDIDNGGQIPETGTGNETEIRVPGTGMRLDAGWAHADVMRSNHASTRVMEKLGGIQEDGKETSGARVGWRIAWTELDVGK